MSQFFTKDNTDRIKKAAEGHVLEVIRDFQDMEEQKGYDYRGKCPVCGKQTFNSSNPQLSSSASFLRLNVLSSLN